MSWKQRSGFVIHLLVMAILMFGQASSSHALTIGIPGTGTDWNWVSRYAVGMCEAKYNSQRFMTWQQVLSSADDGIAVQDGEAICVIGHGRPGFIGTVAADDIARIILSKVNHVKSTTSTILLMACSSAVQQGQGQASVLQAFVQRAANTRWHGETTIAGSLGICVADKVNGLPPLYRVVLKPFTTAGACSRAALTDLQNAFAEAVVSQRTDCINNPPQGVTTEQCLYNSELINDNFYKQFLGYIRANGCNQDNGGVDIAAL
jgi:hypothetical protein